MGPPRYQWLHRGSGSGCCSQHHRQRGSLAPRRPGSWVDHSLGKGERKSHRKRGLDSGCPEKERIPSTRPPFPGPGQFSHDTVFHQKHSL